MDGSSSKLTTEGTIRDASPPDSTDDRRSVRSDDLQATLRPVKPIPRRTSPTGPGLAVPLRRNPDRASRQRVSPISVSPTPEPQTRNQAGQSKGKGKKKAHGQRKGGGQRQTVTKDLETDNRGITARELDLRGPTDQAFVGQITEDIMQDVQETDTVQALETGDDVSIPRTPLESNPLKNYTALQSVW